MVSHLFTLVVLSKFLQRETALGEGSLHQLWGLLGERVIGRDQAVTQSSATLHPRSTWALLKITPQPSATTVWSGLRVCPSREVLHLLLPGALQVCHPGTMSYINFSARGGQTTQVMQIQTEHRLRKNGDYSFPWRYRYIFRVLFCFVFDLSRLDGFAFYSTVAQSGCQVCTRFLVSILSFVFTPQPFLQTRKLLKPKPKIRVLGYKDWGMLFLFREKQSVSSCLSCGTAGLALIWALKYFLTVLTMDLKGCSPHFYLALLAFL